MTYMGAKTGAGVYQTIIALMPPHDYYVEPFAGSAAIYRLKPPARSSYLLDKHAPVVEALEKEFRPRPGGPLRILQYDALEWLEEDAGYPMASRQGKTLVYADPPYPWSTRGQARYPCDMTDADHERLADALNDMAAAGAAVIVSSYPSKLYDRLYAGWNTREMQAMTRGGVRTEKLWFNFEPGAAHWSTFAGRNFTDRQRIKRKAERWAARFAKMPAAERQAVLAAILAAGDRS